MIKSLIIIWSVVAIGLVGFIYFKIQDYRMAHRSDVDND